MTTGKILVIGTNGMLGYAVAEYFASKGYSIQGLCRKQFDIARDSMDSFKNLVDNPAVVINCAGVIKPLISKTPIEDVLSVNSIFPRNLALFCNERQIPCFHFSTDCAYNGQKGSYDERDYFDAEDVYGMSKIAGESSQCMNIRTSIIGEEKGQSRSLLEWAKSQANQEVNGFVNHIWNGVTTTYLAELVEKIVTKGLYTKGIFHVFSPEKVSKLELLEMFNETYQLGLKIKPMRTPVGCDRSLSSIYPAISRIADKPLKKQIIEMKEFFDQRRQKKTSQKTMNPSLGSFI